MPVQCIVCKSHSIPGDRSRSFHKFPKHGIRQTWMTVIGLEEIPSLAKVCSDHFDESCFADTDDYNSIRRLKPTAVPTQRMQNGDDILPLGDNNDVHLNNISTMANLHTPALQSMNQDFDTSCSSCDSMMLSSDRSRHLPLRSLADMDAMTCTDDTPSNEEIGPEFKQEQSDFSDGEKNMEREFDVNKIFLPAFHDVGQEETEDCLSDAVSDVLETHNHQNLKSFKTISKDVAQPAVPEKRTRIKVGCRFYDFCKEDFSSIEKWRDFHVVIKHLHRVQRTTQMRAHRYRKKIKSLKN